MKENLPDRNQSLKPVEVAVAAYLLITALLIVFSREHIKGWYILLIIRSFILLSGGILIFNRQIRISETLRIFLPFLFLGYFYAETDKLNNLFFSSYFDRYFVVIEHQLFGFQPAVEFSSHFPYPVLSEMMFFGYFAYYILSIGIPFYIYKFIDRHSGERFAGIIVISFLIYYAFFIIYPTAGPQFYLPEGMVRVPEGYLFEPLIRLIQTVGEGATGAFPSSHVSICLMLLWGSWLFARKLLVFLVPVSILLILSTVYIGAHYAIDVIGGFLFTPVIFFAADAIYSMLETGILKTEKIWTSESVKLFRRKI